jgi:hypothetical protein
MKLWDGHFKVLRSGGPMQVQDVAQAVLNAGYSSSDKELAHTVGAALREMRGVRKVARGVYRRA